MKINLFKYLLTSAIFLIAAFTIACSGKSGKLSVPAGEIKAGAPEEAPRRLIKMTMPEENAEFKLGDSVRVVLEPENINQQPDSIILTFDGKHVATLKSVPWEYQIPSSSTTFTGRKPVKATAFKNGNAKAVVRLIIVYSDKPPKRYGYKVIHTFPHDKDAFTQGLFFSNGVLYEGTGQQTGSTLREVELTTGKVIRQLNLSSDLFGEGITLYNNRIYQVTWQSKVGFVYERSTFRQINKVYYQSEGWGLTTIDDRIVMSDGSNVLYFYEPESFTVLSRVEVYDDERKVDSLNELEYINGEIWANLWMKNLIARIDPASGKVTGYIDLKGILTDPDTDTGVNVLNGIAFDSENNRIFVTGKNWPKLFEIRVTE
ncbi:MAG: glutaminyl-peptide cyclotransferase [Bacteroidales bacterium]|jgi:glutamine cyclotransferase|nr:glutaminyl-peptide cyclotransferase [Bacteroidales bacterium]